MAKKSSNSAKKNYWLYGRHSVFAALANPSRRIHRIVCTKDKDRSLSHFLIDIGREDYLKSVQVVDKNELQHYVGLQAVHQGVAVLVAPLPVCSVEDISQSAERVLVLDHVTDPRNVGNILRSATAFNCGGVIVQERHAPREDGALAKAASGGLEHVPLIREVNLARTLKKLKQMGFWVIGLDAGQDRLDGGHFKGEKVALVLGAEGEGVRPLIAKHCDTVLGLYMPGAMESLNVAVAAAVGLYEVTRFS